jgi:hypothetical protein
MAFVLDDLGRLASCSSPSTLRPTAWCVATALAAPHFLYAFIWFRPHVWRGWFGAKAVDAFALCGALGKCEQAGQLGGGSGVPV